MPGSRRRSGSGSASGSAAFRQRWSCGTSRSRRGSDRCPDPEKLLGEAPVEESVHRDLIVLAARDEPHRQRSGSLAAGGDSSGSVEVPSPPGAPSRSSHRTPDCCGTRGRHRQRKQRDLSPSVDIVPPRSNIREHSGSPFPSGMQSRNTSTRTPSRSESTAHTPHRRGTCRRTGTMSRRACSFSSSSSRFKSGSWLP